MKNIKLIIEYSGTNYCGWQRQLNAPTVQGTLEKALSSILSEEIEVTGCSRTDAGVHASNYCANFHTDTAIPPERISLAVHHALPSDILVKSSCEVPENFHARYDTKSKIYRYYFSGGTMTHPLFEDRIWQTKAVLDMPSMEKAAAEFIGTYEFDAFRNSDPFSENKSTEKTIYSTGIFRPFTEFDNVYCFEIMGNGFLYNMVRIITGTIVYAGCGKIPPSSIKDIILSKDRKKAGVTAPACGLYLHNVNY